MPTPTVGVTSRLISVSAQNNSTWTQRTADISDYIGCDARLVVLYQSGSSFTGDAQLDTFNIGGTTYNPTDNGTAIGGVSLQVTTNQPSPGADLDDINSEYNAITWSDIATATTTGRWNRDSGGTPSGGTGNTSGNSGAFYIYAETSTSGVGFPNEWFWLRTPEVTITTSTLSLFTAQNGATCGPIYVYLDVTSVPDPNVDVPVTGNQLTQNFSPEYDLTLTGALPAGVISSGAFTDRTQSIVFAGEVQLPSSFTQTECLWEHGGVGIGAWLGVSKILDTYYLRFRASEGDPTVQDNTPDDICLQDVAISSIPEFDGNTHTVVFELKPSAPSRIQLWIDGREVINTEKATAMEGGSWAGADVGGWGAGFSSIAGGTAFTDGGTTQYQATTAWSGTIVSPLRYYANQLADFGADVTVTAGANVSPTGVSATATVGTATVEADANVPETGLQATGNVGSVTVTADANVPEAGLQATGNVGSVTITADANVFPTGESSTGAVGSVVVTGTAVVTPSGLEATSTVGTVIVVAEANIFPTGVSAANDLGTVAVIAEANVAVTGVETTGAVGSVVVTGTAVVTPSGLEATSTVGTVIVVAEANIFPTGVSAANDLGTVVVIAEANVAVTGLEGTSELGTVNVSAATVVTPNGLEATSTVGTVIVVAEANVAVVGAQAEGIVGVVNVWGEIDDDQTPNWQNISGAQSPVWGEIDESQTPSWQNINGVQSPSWGTVDESQTPDWHDIAV